MSMLPALDLVSQTTAVWLVAAAQKMPEPEDVKAGWLGFAVFLALAAAVAFLGFSLSKHLRKVNFEEQADGPAVDPDATVTDVEPQSRPPVS
ncbi:hypothetical protein [Nocardioides mesophilus]|uniref:Uncharacterized protein n=1 Tax=Nocardioides mesophilus TaxID=433659 RepID=A0A7G9R7S4_9ACTN|nr:hypothetical protein [Nocardioides mesophilus]QNN51649.1 hypothetical protein H9L09_13870 [Nocardioides mesophilus]